MFPLEQSSTKLIVRKYKKVIVERSGMARTRVQTALELKSSSKRIGQLYPILVDYRGNIIDGEHRFGVDEKWRTVRLEHIKTEKDRLVARIVSNTVRRSVSSKEKTELLSRLGEIHLNEGVEPGRIAYKIADETGMSYRWVAKYLPGRFKDSVKSEARVARYATNEDKLTDPPKEKILTVQKYGNTDFVNIFLEKAVYTKLERVAEKLGTTPDVIISNALLLALKRLEGKTREGYEKRQDEAAQR